MRAAVVIGATGQDGRILTAQLLEQGRPVVGFDLGAAFHKAPGEAKRAVEPLELRDAAAVRERLKALQPWAVFFLAAVHHSSEDDAGDDRALFAASTALHLDAAVNVLDALRLGCADGRFFYAASSHLFGVSDLPMQDEQTPWRPDSVYGITKAAGSNATRYYRQTHGLHASVGILFNHESALRPPRFLSRRVILGAREAKRASLEGRPYTLELGSLSSEVDWGWAPDTTKAMQAIVSHEEGGDWVIGTGQAHSVDELCRLAFAHQGLDSRQWVREKPSRLRRATKALVGDSRALRAATGWQPSLTFEQLVRQLAEEPPDAW